VALFWIDQARAIKRNPCRIKGAGQEHSPERPVLRIAQVYAVANAVGQRYQALVLLAMFGSLRWGELAGLRRCDIDLDARTVRVTRQLTELRGGEHLFGPPKSKAGLRTVPIPELIIPVIRWHLTCFAQDADEGLVFTSATAERRSLAGGPGDRRAPEQVQAETQPFVTAR
jgi:integrase